MTLRQYVTISHNRDWRIKTKILANEYTNTFLFCEIRRYSYLFISCISFSSEFLSKSKFWYSSNLRPVLKFGNLSFVKNLYHFLYFFTSRSLNSLVSLVKYLLSFSFDPIFQALSNRLEKSSKKNLIPFFCLLFFLNYNALKYFLCLLRKRSYNIN